MAVIARGSLTLLVSLLSTWIVTAVSSGVAASSSRAVGGAALSTPVPLTGTETKLLVSDVDWMNSCEENAPASGGAKLTVTSTLAPGAIWIASSKATLKAGWSSLAETSKTVSGEPPVLLSVSVRVWVVPVPTSPNARASGVTLRTGPPAAVNARSPS